jgi:Winged helix DNA-binding domain
VANSSPAGVPRLSWAQACTARLDRHGLAAPLAGGTPAEVASRVCGAHAQVMSAAEWSIGLRLTGSSRSDVQAALWTERSLVKTFGPRGTVHLLPAADLARWCGALSAVPRPPARAGASFLTVDQAESVVSAIGIALQSAELTIDELSEAVVADCGGWAGDHVIPAFNGMWPRWRQALSQAAARGVACFGPDRGRNVTYTSPRSWLPGFEPAPASGALSWLVTQYLTAYGPATPAQFAQWLGAPRRWAAELFGSLAPGLQQVELDESAAWLPAGAHAGSARPGAVRLLPYFDPYVVGCHPRQSLFPRPAAERGLNRTGQAGTKPVLLIEGTVAGLWHTRRSGRTISVTVEPFADLTSRQRHELAGQAERLGEFFGCAVRLTLGPVSARSHL